MTIVIHGATVATVDADDTVIYDGAVAVAGDRILSVGQSGEVLARYPQAEKIDATGKAIMPGFANVHTHLHMTLARGIYEDLSPPHRPPFTSGLAPLPVPALDPDEHQRSGAACCARGDSQRHDRRARGRAGIENYARIWPIPACASCCAERAWDKAKGNIGDPAPFEVDRKLGERCIARIEALHAQVPRRGQWPHSRRRLRLGARHVLAGTAARRARPAAQARYRRDDPPQPDLGRGLRGRKPMRDRKPTEYLADIGFLNDRLICAHCRCMVPRRRSDCWARRGTCRLQLLHRGAPRLEPAHRRSEGFGCNIGMGTDNMAEDMVEVMRTGMFMERVRREDGRQPTPEQAMRWATVNGYRAMGIPDGGSLVPGNKADLIMIDFRRAHLVPRLRVVSTFVHQGQGRDVTDVMVDGRWLMRDGKVLTMDEERIVAEAQGSRQNRLGAAVRQRPDLEADRVAPAEVAGALGRAGRPLPRCSMACTFDTGLLLRAHSRHS